MNTLFTTTFGQFDLTRYPKANQSLQAFDAADEYLINTVATLQAKPLNVLILNDQFGALACALAKQSIVSSSGDSYLAQLALQQNLASNQLEPSLVNFIPSTQAFSQAYDLVLIRVPKTLALLEQQLIDLQPHISEHTCIIAGAMIKHLSKSVNLLLDKYIGSVQASLAVKKARLLHVKVQPRAKAISPYPSYYRISHPDLTLINHANVFCREGLDIGTRALLPYLPKNLDHCQVADLGCGNGILGIIFALNNPKAKLTLVDESYMAVASAEQNWQNAVHGRDANIKVADGLATQIPNSLDIVLCNPPFHQQQAIGDFLAWRMFKQAYQSLKSHGELWIVSNRHLNYSIKLKKLFSNVTQMGQNSKFIITKAIK